MADPELDAAVLTWAWQPTPEQLQALRDVFSEDELAQRQRLHQGLDVSSAEVARQLVECYVGGAVPGCRWFLTGGPA